MLQSVYQLQNINFGEHRKNLLFSDLQCYAITICFCDLVAKIIAYNPVHKLLNYLLSYLTYVTWQNEDNLNRETINLKLPFKTYLNTLCIFCQRYNELLL